MERKIGGICRAVAVRVAESTSKNKTEKTDNINQTDKKKMVNDSLPEKASHEASTLAHPPEMPIVIDDLAVEDILGVSTCIYILGTSKIAFNILGHYHDVKTPA